jgi:hypothetical protein
VAVAEVKKVAEVELVDIKLLLYPLHQELP